MTQCINCGAEATGARCRDCNAKVIQRRALEETADRDRQVLAMVEAEGLNASRLASRLGVSRVTARKQMITARRREEERKALGIA